MPGDRSGLASAHSSADANARCSAGWFVGMQSHLNTPWTLHRMSSSKNKKKCFDSRKATVKPQRTGSPLNTSEMPGLKETWWGCSCMRRGACAEGFRDTGNALLVQAELALVGYLRLIPFLQSSYSGRPYLRLDISLGCFNACFVSIQNHTVHLPLPFRPRMCYSLMSVKSAYWCYRFKNRGS